MKNQPTPLNNADENRRSAWPMMILIALLVLSVCGPGRTVFAATVPPHGVVAANIAVVINSFDNDTNAVTLSTPYRIGDFRVPYGNNGDYDVQIGPERTNDFLDGILISSVRENGRDDSQPLFPGTNLCTSHIDFHDPGDTNAFGELIENAYWIPVSLTRPNSLGTTVGEWDANVAAAWFPYNKWIGGFARNATSDNGGANNAFTGSPGLVLGTHFVDLGGGRAKVNLTSLGIDSRTNGVLLVMGAKNEDNYGLSQVNTSDGTWNLFSKDNGSDAASYEQDPLAFVFIPKTETNVISGRFLGNGNITMYSGNSPQFTVTSNSVGTWELKIPGKSPRFGVLILSPEGGLTGNQDNAVTYQVNDAGDGWIINSWDLPSPDTGGGFPPFLLPPLETPGNGTEPVADFVFIPGATPGFVVTPINNLYTTEGGTNVQFTVVLEAPPTDDVTINVSSDNLTEGTVSVPSLTFTPGNWDVPQVVTVTGQDDGSADGPVTYHIVLSAATSADLAYNGIDPADPTVANLDNETPFTVVPGGGLVTTEAGGQAIFYVYLNSAPAADVTIGLTSSDSTEGTVLPSSLTFTIGNWGSPQMVTVTGVNDSLDDGDIAYTITTAPATSADPNFNTQNPPDVSVINMDDETAGVSISAAGAGVTFGVVEGKTNTYTVVLDSQPTADVTVTLAGNNASQGGTVSPPSLVFSTGSWNTPQLVSVVGADDFLLDGNTSWRITNSVTSADGLYAGIAPIVVSAVTLDNEPGITLPSGEVFYGAGSPAVGLDGRATITDDNAGSYNGVTLAVAITVGGTADDRLEIRNTGSGAGEIGVSGSTISYGGIAIGSFTGGVGVTPLVVTFNASATSTSAQALLRNVSFRNVNSNPSVATRTLAITLTHLDGGFASVATSVRVGPFRVADFQEGADHGYGVYSGQADIELYENLADVAQPRGHSGSDEDPRMWVDGRAANTTEEAQVLMRFDNIIGNGAGQVPPGAQIVSAELLLTVIDQGDGSPLFRMKIPWNEESDTWLSFGSGVQIDDVEARSSYDSQIGVLQVSGDTGAGQIVVGVTEDIQAWANGETNYGWAMVSWDQDLNAGWSRGTDGMAFRPSEAPNIDQRPRLRVIWVPTNTISASFRQNVNAYTGAQDTRIRQGDPDASVPTATILFVDAIVFGSTNNPDQVLIRFDDIIGTGPGQVPAGSTVSAAILDLATLGGNGYGDGGRFYSMLAPWSDTSTWNSMVNGIQTDDVEALSTPSASAGSATLNPNVCGGFMSFEVTTDVQAWVSGARPNYGWAILPWPGGGDGWGVAMSESSAVRDRPRLRIYYTPGLRMLTPVVSPSNVQVHFAGPPGTSCTIWRAGAVTGTYSSIGNAAVGGGGTGSFIDNAPLPGAAFYRISAP